ncbi:MAG: prepilin-type N-terminal cleavage/methylation domain-containing protein [Candidatus Magasanikbacteria bacterium]|nr:prepilin-type N-terminal cleavage/methylation domain-containing protein [Candidatus Magasanikbacteria bacterium]
MLRRINKKGFTLVEMVVAIAILAIFAMGIYSSLQLIYKVVYLAKVKVLETSILSEELEIARNLPFIDVGIANAFDVPGVLLPTKTITRNGIDFIIVNTVRFIDDPFDGTITTPAPDRDPAPADYKLVEMAIYCTNINQTTPLILSTIIGPNKQEDATGRGALFIEVVDSLGRLVSQANVRVEMFGSSSYKDEVTDDEGHLYIINVPTGTLLYNIIVTKDGFTKDFTASTTATNTNPIKPFATVVDDTASDLGFAIDIPSNLNIKTVNSVCSGLSGININTYGKKLLGLPDILKFNKTGTTGAGGILNYENIEWDEFISMPTGTPYDLAGSIPMSSLVLNAGETQQLTLILRPHTSNSLLVKVKDNITGMPIAEADVRLYSTSTGYDKTYKTGLGYYRQTDWSGGSGQEIIVDETKYFSDDNKIDVSEEGKIKLKKLGDDYYEEGCLMSSIFDTGQEVDFRNIFWETLIQPVEVGTNSVRVQVSTSNTTTPDSWDFFGPAGTDTDWYTADTTLINSMHNGQQYFRYKICLNTASTTFTPEIEDVFFIYTNGCTPPGQVFFGSLATGEYLVEVTKDGYLDADDAVIVSGNLESKINMLLP